MSLLDLGRDSCDVVFDFVGEDYGADDDDSDLLCDPSFFVSQASMTKV